MSRARVCTRTVATNRALQSITVTEVSCDSNRNSRRLPLNPYALYFCTFWMLLQSERGRGKVAKQNVDASLSIPLPAHSPFCNGHHEFLWRFLCGFSVNFMQWFMRSRRARQSEAVRFQSLDIYASESTLKKQLLLLRHSQPRPGPGRGIHLRRFVTRKCISYP